jgi:hypothetical protein
MSVMVPSVASSAASMDRKALETRVIQLETQLLLAARDQKRANKQNQDQHAKVLRETEGIVEKINTIDMYSLWWVEQALNQRKKSFDFKHASLTSYKNYVWRNKEKQNAGMDMNVTPNHNRRTPQ